MGFTNQNTHKHVSDYEADMFTGITTYHGLVRIYNSKAWSGRIFWITVVIVAFSLFVFQAAQLLQAYHMKPTNYQTEYIVPENGVQFPAVTICNVSPLKRERAETYSEHINENITRYLMMSYLTVENLHTFGFANETISDLDRQFQEFKKKFHRSTKVNFTIQHFFRNSGFKCDEMFIACVYNGIKFNCCDPEYISPIMTDAGMCFKFQYSGNNVYLSREFVAGQAYGLQLILNVSTNSYPSYLPGIEYGIKFHLHRPEEQPFMSAKGIGLPPGTKGFAAVSLNSWHLLDKANWGQCQSDWKGNDDPIFIAGPYTMANCQVNCMANVFRKNCLKRDGNTPCVPIRYHLNDSLEVCSPKELYECMDIQVMMNAFSKQEVCNGRKCSSECEKLEYQTVMSYAAIKQQLSLSNPLFEQIQKAYGDDTATVQDNIVILNVYMRDVAYTEYTQQRSLDATVILSNIGGNTGMFLGMSIITLAEIFVFFTKYIWVHCSGQRTKIVTQKLQEEL